MPSYHEFMMRHGEHGVQTIIEQIERLEGIRPTKDISLESRWNALQHDRSSKQQAKAA